MFNFSEEEIARRQKTSISFAVIKTYVKDASYVDGSIISHDGYVYSSSEDIAIAYLVFTGDYSNPVLMSPNELLQYVIDNANVYGMIGSCADGIQLVCTLDEQTNTPVYSMRHASHEYSLLGKEYLVLLNNADGQIVATHYDYELGKPVTGLANDTLVQLYWNS